ncbi:MAG: gamma-glutamylcyclotransferase [Halioglobus sp.]|nr:gamma-glutamylcyclotransferase [Halioglobus sp.]
MRYFAYGSNMSLPRLLARLPSARKLDVCTLAGHDMRFHKRSVDGSAKCDAFETARAQDRMIGILFDVDAAQKPALDRIEGLGHGYEIKRVRLVTRSGESTVAYTYFATWIDRSLLPYSWYLYHVLHGARQAALPSDYIARIEAVHSVQDPDSERDARERAVYR